MFVVNYFVNAEDLLDGVIEDAQLQVNVGILGGVCVLKTDYFFKVKKTNIFMMMGEYRYVVRNSTSNTSLFECAEECTERITLVQKVFIDKPRMLDQQQCPLCLMKYNPGDHVPICNCVWSRLNLPTAE